MPSKKQKIHTLKIYCAKCKTLLYKYEKEGKGHLVKCYKDRIIKDNTKGDLKCPNCGEMFAREAMIHGKPANKIIQGKVYTRR
jgi:DNA-directed RNA polymerase subunit M/transcription elongation factor TFIIS